MSSSGGFKFTYTTLSAPAEEVHEAFEEAVDQAKETLGGTHPIWIGGSEATSVETFANRSPVDRKLLIGRFQQASREQTAAAIEAARQAFDGWRKTPWRSRVAILRRAADELSERRYELAALMSLEVGKTRFEALADAEEAADLIRYYSQQMEDAEGFDRPMGRLAPNEQTRDLLRPYGVWVVISPFNFPVALAAGMCGGALVAGNTVVYKPASEAPASGLKLYEILAGAGLPPGVVNFITGPGPSLGEEITTHPAVEGLVFTGSKEVGQALFRQFTRAQLRPCYLELGGKNPAVVTARADLEKAVDGVCRAAFGFGGQKCSACSRVYVERAVADRFKTLLAEKAASLTMGDPTRRESFLGPVINEEAVRKYDQCVAEARRDGTVLCGGEKLTGAEYESGLYVTPTVVADLPHDHRLFSEELFLPFLCVGEAASLEEAIELANRTEYGLTAGIFSEDEGEVEQFFDGIQAGVTYANRGSGATTGAWPGVNPFCGWKASGSTGKGVCGPYYVQQFLREQSRTVML
jgi:1-pyrroline-5-carboxylate dehydrogenase